MPSTSPDGFPYPTLASGADVPLDVKALADAVQAKVITMDAALLALAADEALRVRTAVKTTDHTSNNSTAPVNDPHLALSVAANTTYAFESCLFYSAATAADVKFSLTGPAGAIGRTSDWGGGISAVNPFDAVVWGALATLTLDWAYGGTGVGAINAGRAVGTIITAGTAGTLQLRFSQFVANASDAKLYAASWIRLTRV